MVLKVLITGGAGFIGSHLAERCMARGDELVIVDNLSTGQRANIEHLLDGPCHLIEASIGEALAADRSLLDGVGQVYHLAAAVGVRTALQDPLHTMRANVNETDRILEAGAANAGVNVLIASSSEVYGKSAHLPMHEDDDLVIGPPTAPRWCYGLSKALDEQLALAYHHQRGLGVVVVRLFNVIGPRQIGRYGMVVPRFVGRAVQQQDLQIFGDGTQRRTFCDVRDVVQAMTTLMDGSAHHGQVFNLGSDDELSINDLADKVIAASGSSAGKTYVAYDQAYGRPYEDPMRRVPDLRRIGAAIGFERRYSLQQTLTDLIQLQQPPQPDRPPSALPVART